MIFVVESPFYFYFCVRFFGLSENLKKHQENDDPHAAEFRNHGPVYWRAKLYISHSYLLSCLVSTIDSLVFQHSPKKALSKLVSDSFNQVTREYFSSIFLFPSCQ